MRILMLLLVFLSSAWAGLDDPGAKRVTVGSELQRGYTAIDHALILEAGDEVFRHVDAANDLLWDTIRKNQQLNLDSDGFKTGAFLAMAFHFKVLIADGKFDHKEKAQKYFNSYLGQAQKTQNRLQLSNSEVSDACGISEEWLRNASLPTEKR